MAQSEHPWCRDVSRDEAIRLAEDIEAAARVPLPDHRDLPAAVAKLRERVARLEAVIPKSVSVSNAEAHENKGGTMPADGLRTERVTLEVTHRSPVSVEGWALHSMLSLEGGESVRVVEEGELSCSLDAAIKGMERAQRERDDAISEYHSVAAERDAALRERDAALARVAVMKAAPAANAGGEQQPPRGWLTPEERKVLTEVADEAEKSPSKERWAHVASCVRGLLARETPPRVKVPTAESSFSWIVAILEAGGEVE